MTPKHDYSLDYPDEGDDDLHRWIDDDNRNSLYVLTVDGEPAFAVGISRDGYLRILRQTPSGWDLLRS